LANKSTEEDKVVEVDTTKSFKMVFSMPSVIVILGYFRVFIFLKRRKTTKEYVLETVNGLVERVAYNDLSSNIKLVIYNANVPAKDHRGPHLVKEKYGDLIASGNLEIIENPGKN
jgi:hypothetical protein